MLPLHGVWLAALKSRLAFSMRCVGRNSRSGDRTVGADRQIRVPFRRAGVGGEEGRTPDQQDAFAIAKRLQQADSDGSLQKFLSPEREPHERKKSEIVDSRSYLEE